MEYNTDILLCNYNKNNTQNKAIYEYNFTKNLTNPPILYRGHFNVCHQYINLDKDNMDLYKDINNKITNFYKLENKFIPGKGQGSDFLKFIDVDSELKNLNIIDSKCRETNYNNRLPNNYYEKTSIYDSIEHNYNNENIWNNLTKKK